MLEFCCGFFVTLLLTTRAQTDGPDYIMPYENTNRVARCRNPDGSAKQCVPEFKNVAYNVPVDVTNTCGVGRAQYFCVQTGASGARKKCDICEQGRPGFEHPPAYLTDFNNPRELTWWQSETMEHGVQYPTAVNLTLKFGKTFEVTYVRLKFHSSRPESFAIYKKTTSDGDWIPWQYYRCQCNGHASQCNPSTGQGHQRTFRCECDHHTQGADCEKCQAFYNDQPWQRATNENPNECKACNCSGLSNRCYFDEKMWRETGSGGHCIDCQGYTTGPHCEKCLENHFRIKGRPECQPCNCDETGSLTLQCDEEGQCPCKPGVGGRFCDRCMENFYDFSLQGCKSCGCVDAGSHGNVARCDSGSGHCTCKANVEGRQCDRCKPGFFNLDTQNEFGCLACFCFGHTSVCDSAPGYFVSEIKSNFEKGGDDWMGIDHTNSLIQVQHSGDRDSIGLSGHHGTTYFVAPSKFHGNQQASYNRYLKFKFRVSDPGASASLKDVIIESTNGQHIAIPIFAQDNPTPSTDPQEYKFRLHEHTDFAWNPRLPAMEFMQILSNVTAIKIRSSYTPQGWGFLSEFTLDSASQTPSSINGGDPEPAEGVETCECPEGFMGQYCEDCAPGYRREVPYGGKFARCIKCNCNDHAELCEAESGKCICEDNTGGDNCERCARGYYGDAKKGTSEDCAPCPCPEDGPCVLHTDGDIICTECPIGYTGRRCEMCADGYFGDPANNISCKLCECNGNIDQNNIGNCDRVTGECKKCIFNTHGFQCEKCLPGFYGDALLEPKGDCKPCDCYPVGAEKGSTDALECDQSNGQCYCLAHVQGRRCDECEAGFFNLASGKGCDPCNCDPAGSEGDTCELVSGQCTCKPGVTGQKCDSCQAFHYGFGYDGCEDCNCFPIGSKDAQCDVKDGQCSCRPNIEGRRCDACIENMYDLEAGCRECPPCYSLVQSLVNEHREKLGDLKELINGIKENPQAVNDTQFDEKLKEVSDAVDKMLEEVSKGIPDDKDLEQKLQKMWTMIDETTKVFGDIETTLDNTEKLTQEAKDSMREWDAVKDRAYLSVEDAKSSLKREGERAWEEAVEASENFGSESEKLSGIAKQAREKAAEQKAWAEHITEFAQEAKNKSSQALQEANDAVSGKDKRSREIERLKDGVSRVEELLNGTKRLGEETLEKAQKAHSEAAEVLNEVNSIQLPQVETEKIKDKSQSIIVDSENSKQEAQDMVSENRAVLQSANEMKRDANYALDKAKAQQQRADQLLGELDAAKQRATDALAKAEQTLKEANETLKTLKEFDALVAQSKDEAKEAWKGIPDIKKIIEDAENKTKEAQKALGNAEEDAKAAENIATEAETAAKEASDVFQDAQEIRDDAEKTKKSALDHKNRAVKILAEISEQKITLDNYRINLQEDEKTAGKALQTASQANQKAQNANKTVEDINKRLEDILTEINSIEEVKDEDLERLEQELEEAEKALKEADLENELGDLKGKQETQMRKVESYKDELETLEKEVQNIRQIRDSLPQQCFNLVDLEQPKR